MIRESKLPRARSRGQGVGGYFRCSSFNQRHGKGGGWALPNCDPQQGGFGAKMSRRFSFSSERGSPEGSRPKVFGRSVINLSLS